MENAPMRSACSASVNWLAAEKPAGSPGRNDGQRSGRIPFAAHQMRMILIIK
ncbi:2-alkenal reductase [Ralstonia solanacearum]|nr:2-alkenal reductase [Ralstonia solanacearum]